MEEFNEELNDICTDLDDLSEKQKIFLLSFFFLLPVVVTIRSGVKEARNLKNYEARENKLVFLEDRIVRAKTVYESLQLEIRSHGKNNDFVNQYRDKARHFKETINELIQETNAARAEQGGVVMSTEQIMINHSEKFSTGQM